MIMDPALEGYDADDISLEIHDGQLAADRYVEDEPGYGLQHETVPTNQWTHVGLPSHEW